MASGLGCAVQLSSTPPLQSQIRPGSGTTASSKRGGLAYGFKAGTSGDEVGSFKGASVGSRSLIRSSVTAGQHAPLAAQNSIPKAAQFVKIEGFATKGASPPASPPASPQPRLLNSLLTRQLSVDNLSAGASYGASSSLGAGGLGSWAGGSWGSSVRNSSWGSAEDPALLARRLQQAISVAPVPRPGGVLRRAAPPALPDDLLAQLQRGRPVFAEPLVQRAFGIARFAHDGKYRASGDPAFLHCVEVAGILADLGADEATVAAALLHDVLDNTLLVEGQLRPMLGDEGVLDLVRAISHLGDVSSKYRDCPATTAEGRSSTAGAMVSMLVAMGQNRALLVKLADRLHDMQTLAALPAAKRNRLAQETIDVWAPLANRLGVWHLKAQLEDLAFKQLCPGQYAELRERLERVQQPEVLVSLIDRLRSQLQTGDIRYVDLSGRPKHLWGVYKKMAAKSYTLDRISDVRGLRVIVDSKEDCYRALRAVQTLWAPVGGVKDYIRLPKANGYQSLHCVVRGVDGHDIEVQIRTAKMHFLAEYGAEAAHWQYKEGGSAAAAKRAAARAPEGPAGVNKETAWAKWVVSQQVLDKKCRPSGSPSGDHSLAALVGATAALASGSSSDEGDSPGSSPPRDQRFAAYLQRSGQALEPPPAERVMVCVVAGGGLEVRELPKGTTVLELLQCHSAGMPLRGAQVLVNKHIETNPSAQLVTGDVVEIYGDPSAAPLGMPPSPAAAPLGAASPAAAAAPQRQQQPEVSVLLPVSGLERRSSSNVVPLKGLKLGSKAPRGPVV